MIAPVRIQSPRHGKWFPELPERLAEAAATYDFAETPEWAILDQLSSNTEFEGLNVSGDSAVIEDGQLVAPGTIHVKLVYEKGGADETSFHDSYPARVFFEADNATGRVRITRVEADVSSFFED